jgi:hypothetical protein
LNIDSRGGPGYIDIRWYIFAPPSVTLLLRRLHNDPYESTNVIDKHPEVVEKIRKAYDQWWMETVPQMVNEDRPYAKEHPQEVRYEKQLKERGIPDWKPPKL